jgi:hypothetical protein
MSVHFPIADTIVASTSSSCNALMSTSGQDFHHTDDINSMSNRVPTQALMMSSNSQDHQGGLYGTPDANASSMSSNHNNFKQENTSRTAHLPHGLSAQDLFAQLHEALALEPKYQPSLFLPQQSNVSLILLFYFLILRNSAYEFSKKVMSLFFDKKIFHCHCANSKSLFISFYFFFFCKHSLSYLTFFCYILFLSC